VYGIGTPIFRVWGVGGLVPGLAVSSMGLLGQIIG